MLGALVTVLLILQFYLPNERQSFVKPTTSTRSLAEQWSNSIREDMQFQSDVHRIELVLLSLQTFTPMPLGSMEQDFDREAQSIERQIQVLESQSAMGSQPVNPR